MTSLPDLLAAPGASLQAEDDLEKINALYLERGWSDGLPIVPPTVARVERMLDYCDRAWDEPIARIPPRYGAATPLRLAANAVMAGCRPEYFPLVMLAIEALAEEPFNLYGVQATTHSCSPLLIFNGPIAAELRLNCGHGAFGPGGQANATIGRAVRLALVNLGGSSPGVGDMATYGSPAKYTYCTAENAAASPWEPLHVERGFPAHASTVTVVAAEPPHNVNDHESTTADGVMKTLAGTVATTGVNNINNRLSEPVILFGPEHAATVAKSGFSKQDVKEYLYEHARVPLGKFSDENRERRLRVTFPERFATASLDAMVPMCQSPQDYIVIVVGGAGKHSAVIPTFGNERSVTRALKRRDGSFAGSVEEVRAGRA
ncbi:MAG: hypothetical protein INH00_20680 [Rhodocyclaceae bacterium]|nr:hypothetical protein [Rhodocyclaceae bacterium]